jgi:hypothetical protein
MCSWWHFHLYIQCAFIIFTPFPLLSWLITPTPNRPPYVFVLLFAVFLFETGSHCIALASLEPTAYTSLTSNSQTSTCLWFPSASLAFFFFFTFCFIFRIVCVCVCVCVCVRACARAHVCACVCLHAWKCTPHACSIDARVNVYICSVPHECGCPWRPEGGIGASGTRVIDGGKPSSVGAKTWVKVFWRSNKCL